MLAKRKFEEKAESNQTEHRLKKESLRKYLGLGLLEETRKFPVSRIFIIRKAFRGVGVFPGS